MPRGFLECVRPVFESDYALADLAVFRSGYQVIRPGRQDHLNFFLRFFDSPRVQRVFAHVQSKETEGIGAVQAIHLLERADGAVRVVTGGVAVLHAEVIGRGFVG